jgi:hypothetical protein
MAGPNDPDRQSLNTYGGFDEGQRSAPSSGGRSDPFGNYNPSGSSGGGSQFVGSYSTGSGGSGYAVSQAYSHLASAYGLTLSSGMISMLISGQVSIDEFHQRLMATQRLKDNKTFFDQFEAEVQKAGLGRAFNTQDRLNFILGRSPAQFYNLWNAASSRAAAIEAGFTIGGHGDLGLSRKEARGVAQQVGATGPEGFGQNLQPIYQKAAQLILEVLPIGRLAGYNLSRDEVFSWADQTASAQTMNKVNRLLATEQALAQPLANIGFRPQRGSLSPTVQ